MPLQSTCFQIQFYLVCCSFFCSISRTPLSISSHFAIGRKFPLKASFYTLTPTLSSSPLSQNKKQVHTFTFLHLTVFFIQRVNPFSNSNWLAIEFYSNYTVVFLPSFLPPILNYCKGEDRLVFPNNHFKTSVTAATLLQRARCCSVREVVLCFSLFHFLSFPSFLSTSTIFRFLSSNSLTLHPVFVHKSPLESVFVSFFSAINFFYRVNRVHHTYCSL